MTAEVWKPVVGFEGVYEVSDQGRVRSLDRVIRHIGDSRVRKWKGRYLKPGTKAPSGHQVVALSFPGRGKTYTRDVHRIVMDAFVGPLPTGMDTRHLNGDPRDNRLANLTYGTRSQNMLDKRIHGTDHNGSKTHCIRGHAFDIVNTYWRPEGGRRCRKCKAIREAARRVEKAS